MLDHLSNGFYLVLIYLVISANDLGNLFGCRMQALFSRNIAIKHLLGLFTAYFFIILSSPPENYNHLATILLTVVIYGWFFLTTKMHVIFWIPMILIALLSYFIYIFRTQTKDDEDKSEITQFIQDNGEKIQGIATIVAGVLTVLGVITYYGEKKIEFGNKFDQSTFWIGIPVCRSKTAHVSIVESFKAAFNRLS
jgi:Ca2+/Na+ antiporter